MIFKVKNMVRVSTRRGIVLIFAIMKKTYLQNPYLKKIEVLISSIIPMETQNYKLHHVIIDIKGDKDFKFLIARIFE